MANQFTTQLSEEIRDAVFGNMGTIVSFRVGQNDVEALSRYFKPIFEADDILRVPNYNAIVRTLINGVPTQPFSMTALPSLGTPNPKLGEALMQLSAAKFGKPRAVVDADITQRMKTLEVPKPAFGAGAGTPFGSYPPAGADRPGTAPIAGTAAGPKPAAAGSGSSFLDEWLAKRRTGGGAAASPAGALSPPYAPQPFGGANPAPGPASTLNLSPFDPAQSQPIAPAAPQPQVSAEASSQPVQKTQGEFVIPKPGNNESSEDTIVIDRDGNFQTTQDNSKS